ncbi:hypothetical protein AARAC_003690 [Aspergillus arachidicola]|uniref:Zn(2)-C6 fungal-type domain-containing protein n=1 Tax=Aspergillus arachidicola TaxID=656916 RepID=A0A2G7FMN9_9EURO|nr:hypothetical protein AARAC_003690 [Aspergillus arachidicola]
MDTENALNVMKRSTTEAGPAPKRSAWQQPVSCEFCRLKKVRCDKKRPCYNCTSRGFACEYASVIKPVQSSLGSNKDPSEEQHHTLILDDKLVSLERCETLTLYYAITNTIVKEMFGKSTTALKE